MSQTERSRRGVGNIGGAAGFLTAAFILVGLVGLFCTYALPIPLQRALNREAVLDRVLVTPPGELAALRDPLGESADPVLNGPGPLAARVAAERQAMLARFQADQANNSERLRLLIVVFTLVGAAFGGMMFGIRPR